MTQLAHAVTLNSSIEPPLGQTLTHAGADALLGEALRDIIRERIDQVDRHGFTIEHDQRHAPAELAAAAASYLDTAIDQLEGRHHAPEQAPETWPWTRDGEPEFWRPADPRTNIVKAIAIAWAVLDRIDHAPGDAGDVA